MTGVEGAPVHREVKQRLRIVAGAVWFIGAAGGVVLFLGAATGFAQALYKSVGSDGKVTYSDKPPASSAATVREMPAVPMAPGAAGANNGQLAPRPGVPSVPGVPGVPGVMPAVPLGAGGAPGPLWDEYQSCMKANARTADLARAASDVARAHAMLGRAGATVGSPSQRDALRAQLDQHWARYKALGGTAATPDAVRPPDDPCRQQAEAMQRQQMDLHNRYRSCTETHASEVKLASLSREIVQGRAWIAGAERLQAERQRNPDKFSDTRGSGEWARLAKMDPAEMRAGQAALFQQYRASGGTATRIEEVTELPNPCTSALPGRPAAGASPIVDRKSMALPAQ